jgi:hypothetical protein
LKNFFPFFGKCKNKRKKNASLPWQLQGQVCQIFATSEGMLEVSMLTSSAQERFLSVKIDMSDSQIVSSKSFAKIAQQRLITKQSEMLLENNFISAFTWGQ